MSEWARTVCAATVGCVVLFLGPAPRGAPNGERSPMVAQVVTDERQILERLDGALNDLSRVRIDQEAAERAEAEMARLLRNLMPPRIVSPRISSSPPPWAPVSVGRCQAIPRERPSGEWDPQCP